MKNQLSLLLISICLSGVFYGCQSPEKPKDLSGEATEALEELVANYHQALLAYHPLSATSEGDHRYDDQLDNFLTDEFESELIAFYTDNLAQLAAIDKGALSADDQMTYDVLKWECEISRADYELPMELLPINQVFSRHLYIAQIASGNGIHEFNTVEDYDNWLRRLETFVAWCNSAMQNMEKGVETGFVLPKSLITQVIAQTSSLSEASVEEHVFFMPAKNFPESMTTIDQQRLTAAYTSMIGDKIIPVYKKLQDFLKDKYLPAGKDMAGIQHVPGGKAIYDHYIKYYTTTNMTADEIYALGEREVARIRTEMEAVMTQVGFQGSHREFFDHVRDSPHLRPYDDPQKVIDHFKDIHETMKPNLELLFNLVPKCPFEVRRTEPFREATASWEYNQGSPDGSRPGIFYVPVADVSAYNVFQDESLFLHEAIPGHHYQISLQQENEDLPEFRKNLWYSAYGEGWALYTESLGEELGLYVDPYQHFGMLSMEMHRALRLVLDVGLHLKGWTREEAIQYSLDNEAEPEYSIISEIERYMAAPGQALSYKIGQLKISELRDRAENQLGDEFDIREFHNRVLAPGCIPLALLENSIDAWIAETEQ